MIPAHFTRNYNHRHNALIGSASCFSYHLNAIIDAPSTSPEAKLLAVEMQQLRQRLVSAVRSTRINADGTRTDFDHHTQVLVLAGMSAAARQAPESVPRPARKGAAE